MSLTVRLLYLVWVRFTLHRLHTTCIPGLYTCTEFSFFLILFMSWQWYASQPSKPWVLAVMFMVKQVRKVLFFSDCRILVHTRVSGCWWHMISQIQTKVTSISDDISLKGVLISVLFSFCSSQLMFAPWTLNITSQYPQKSRPILWC